MGRIVYFSLPAHGHINPTLPVVKELVERKHQVLYYSTERFRPAIEETGAQFDSYCAQFSMPEQGPGAFQHVSTTLETLLDLTCAVLEHHAEVVRMWRPSHIMFDSFAPWGHLVARLLGLPTIASIPSILINGAIASRYETAAEGGDPQLTRQWYAAFQSRYRACLRRYELSDAPSPEQLLQTYGDLNLVYTSPLFQPSAEAFDQRRFQFVVSCFSFRPQGPAFPFEQLDGRPLVFISLGTVYANQPRFFRMCLEELAGTPWQVVLATGDQLLAESLGPMPENFIVRSFVPQIEILRRSAVFVTHAGMNSVQEALYHGVPLVMAPQGADQFWISTRASELGAGVVLYLARMEAGTIRRSIGKILSGRRYTAAAARLGWSLRAAGGPMKACNEVETFLGQSLDLRSVN